MFSFYESLDPASALGSMLLVGYGNTGTIEKGEAKGSSDVKRMGVTEIDGKLNLENLGPSLVYWFDPGEAAHAHGDSSGPGLKFDRVTTRPIILGVIQGAMGYTEGAIKWLAQITPLVSTSEPVAWLRR